MTAEQHSKKWRVKIYRWDVYEAREVEAESENAAEEMALALYEMTSDLEHIDGGVLSTDAEEEDE